MLNKYSVAPLLLLTVAINQPAHAHENPYWEDASGNIVRSGQGLCWRSPNWSKGNALAECEGGMKKPMMDMDSDKDGVLDKNDSCPDTPRGFQVNPDGCAKDSDGDGAPDSNDKCPNTPAGVNVDSTGCPLDADGDGVADSNDRCPSTAQGIKVDATGCAMDSDGDGAADSFDKCPGTPKGVEVDATGCEISMDDDNDGIMNASDRCPGTAAGTVVNKQGCELKEDIALDNVQFNTGTADLSSTSRNILDNVAQVLNKNKHLSFEVAGHTDNTGNYKSNVRLSQARANAVRQYLINKGVAANRLSAQGYGPDKPVASNDTRQGRSENRRVELVLQ